MRKTYSEYIEYIKRMLGVNNINLDSIEFNNEDLTEYVKIAFSEILPYISVRDRVTIPWNKGYNGAIAFKEFDIKAKSVTAVKRGSAQGFINGGASLVGTWSSYTESTDGKYPIIPLYTAGGALYSAYGLNPENDPWLTEKLMLKNINETAGDGHFLFDYGKQLLFINFNTATPTSVTIDFIPEYSSAEDIRDDYWTMLLQKKALAIIKLALSQYRGKFSNVDGAPFTLDYQRLQTEGEQLNQEVQNILEENLLNYRFD